MDEIKLILQYLTKHNYLEITLRGNSAIKSALSVLAKGKKVLIPKEGGWLTYHDLPQKLNLETVEVNCNKAKINLEDLKNKLEKNQFGSFGAFLYQNPGGYFAQQPMEEIYRLCKQNGCLVILDVSGSIGTELCDGNYADIIIGSFGKWKLVEARVGGFISCQKKELFDKLELEILNDQASLNIIFEKLTQLGGRIKFLSEKRKKVIEDLSELNLVEKVVYQEDLGFVVIVKFDSEVEKENLINYCNNNDLEWTECPRYIRLNQPAISIEIKRLQ